MIFDFKVVVLVELQSVGEVEVGADAAHIVEPVEGIQQLEAAAGGVGIAHRDAGLGGPVMPPFPHIPVSPSQAVLEAL